MGAHPINLTFRFLLELCALFALGLWGWKQSDHWLRFVLAIGLPLVLAIIWGVFAVPNDPSRAGHAPIVTPGVIRLLIEIGIFTIGVWSLYSGGFVSISIVFGAAVALHYLLSYDRILWLLRH